MELVYLNSETITTVITLFGTVFGAGFMIGVILHYIGYAVFGLLALLNIKK